MLSIDLPPAPTSERPQTSWASRFATVTNTKISQINEEAVPDNTKKARKLGLEVLKVELCLSDWIYRWIRWRKVFCLQMQIKSCVTLFSWKFATPFEEIFPQDCKKKNAVKTVLFVGKKMRRLFGHLCAKIVIVGSGKWVKNHHFCAQVSHSFCQYRLEQFSTSVSVASGHIYWATKRRCPMSDVRGLMSDVWCAMCDVWCLLSDSVPRVRYLTSDGWCLFFDVRCPIFDARSPMSDVRCLKSDVRRLLSPFHIW